MIRERALVAKKKFRVKEAKTALQNKTLPLSLDTAETVIDGMTEKGGRQEGKAYVAPTALIGRNEMLHC